jgi:hypothetical protein
MSLLFTGLNVAWAFHGFFFPAQIMFFCLGMVFATNEGRIDITLDKSLSVVTLIATTVLFVPIQYLLEVRAMPLFGDFYNMTNSYSAMIRISGSLLWASIIILLFKYRFLLYSWGPVRKIFSPLAKNSYYIYLIHPMVLSFAIQFSSQHRFLSTNHFYYPLMMLFVTGVSLVIAVLITSGRNYIRAHK